MNVTRSFDERVVARARQLAAGRSTALDRLIRTDPERLTRPCNTKLAIDGLNVLWYGNTRRSQDPWMREELHERPCVHRQVPAARRHAGCDARPSAPKSRGSRQPPAPHPLSQRMFVAASSRGEISRLAKHAKIYSANARISGLFVATTHHTRRCELEPPTAVRANARTKYPSRFRFAYHRHPLRAAAQCRPSTTNSSALRTDPPRVARFPLTPLLIDGPSSGHLLTVLPFRSISPPKRTRNEQRGLAHVLQPSINVATPILNVNEEYLPPKYPAVYLTTSEC